jgi:hypothetical protein
MNLKNSFYAVEEYFSPKIIGEVNDQYMESGDLFVVKKGINHRVSSTGECLIMLIEPKTTEHTGKVKCAITKTIEEQKR